MKRIGVFCGSSMGVHTAYRDAALQLGRFLAGKKIELVYGGASVGLMQVLADATINAGGFVTGIMPHMLIQKEIVHNGIQHFEAVESMSERKEKMIALSDGFIALPGGFGTLDEISEVLTNSQLRIHDKPIGLLNVKGYFNGLIHFIDHAVAEGFVRSEHRSSILVHTDPQMLLQMMIAWQPIETEKWISDILMETNNAKNQSQG